MINPISSPHASDVQQTAKPIPKAEPEVQTPKSGALSHDQVTLKSAGQVDRERAHE